jgi:hypothetical protein
MWGSRPVRVLYFSTLAGVRLEDSVATAYGARGRCEILRGGTLGLAQRRRRAQNSSTPNTSFTLGRLPPPTVATLFFIGCGGGQVSICWEGLVQMNLMMPRASEPFLALSRARAFVTVTYSEGLAKVRLTVDCATRKQCAGCKTAILRRNAHFYAIYSAAAAHVQFQVSPHPWEPMRFQTFCVV